MDRAFRLFDLRGMRWSRFEAAVTLVVGDDLDSFCLFHNLSRLTAANGPITYREIHWLPALVQAKLAVGDLRWLRAYQEQVLARIASFLAENGDSHARFELFASDSHQVGPIRRAFIRQARKEPIATVYDATATPAEQAKTRQDTIDEHVNQRKRQLAQVHSPEDLLQHHIAYVHLDSDVDVLTEFLDGTAVGTVPAVFPSGHLGDWVSAYGWITEVETEGQRLPRRGGLVSLAADVDTPAPIRHSIRIGSRSVCYTPETLQFVIAGRKPEAFVLRPRLKLVSALDAFAQLAGEVGLCARLSHKGLMYLQTLDLLGGLERLVNALSDPAIGAVIAAFMRRDAPPTRTGEQKGYLAWVEDIKRRVLDEAAIEQAIRDSGLSHVEARRRAVEIIDEWVRAKIIHRGLLLKCPSCKKTDWFYLDLVGASFECRRCRAAHVITSRVSVPGGKDPRFTFLLDEVVHQFFAQRSHLCALLVGDLTRSLGYQLVDAVVELELLDSPGAADPIMEVDVAAIVDGAILLAEVKSAAKPSKKFYEQIQGYVKLASDLSADHFVLYQPGGPFPESLRTKIKGLMKGCSADLSLVSSPEHELVEKRLSGI